jgi:signal transduction histidine kinase
MKRSSVLVVDDEATNFEIIEAFLNPHAYELHYASNGEAALTSLHVTQPDVILLDVMMPGLDGLEVCKRIKTLPQWQTTPIIMVTALSTKKDLARCIEAGADDFLGKPINSIELRARVKSMLRISNQWKRIQTFNQVQQKTIQTLEHTLDELRNGLVSCLSHELNTPLFGVIGAVEYLKEMVDEGDTSDILEILQIADQSTQRLERLVIRLITYVELELSNHPPQLPSSTPTHFSQAAIAQTLETQAQNMERHNDLVLDLEAANVPLSEKYLSFILYELIDNALKFSEPKTPVTVVSKVQDNKLTLTITDHGRGMTDAQIQQIAAFVQFDRQIYEQQGMGLGLKLVKSIVEHSGGRLDVSSQYGQKTTVTVSLPVLTP